MSNKIFTSIKLLNGDKCDILEIKAVHIWKAQTALAFSTKKDLGVFPFLLQQILLINGKCPSIEYLEDIMIDDYLEINAVVDVYFKKIA